jgi:hypothetical protein
MKKLVRITFIVLALSALMVTPVFARSLTQEEPGQPALSDLLLAITGIVISLLFSYFPGLKTWYENQSGKKALIMLGAILVVSLGYFGLACTPLAAKIGIGVACTTDGALIVALAFVKIVIANQATYLLAKK